MDQNRSSIIKFWHSLLTLCQRYQKKTVLVKNSTSHEKEQYYLTKKVTIRSNSCNTCDFNFKVSVLTSSSPIAWSLTSPLADFSIRNSVIIFNFFNCKKACLVYSICIDACIPVCVYQIDTLDKPLILWVVLAYESSSSSLIL